MKISKHKFTVDITWFTISNSLAEGNKMMELKWKETSYEPKIPTYLDKLYIAEE